jgi:hypothetical protein
MSWLRNPFSASIEDLDQPLREFRQLIDMSAERNLKDTLKPANSFNIGLCFEVNTQKLQSMLYKNYCLLFQPTSLRQHFRNMPSLRLSTGILDPEADMRVQLSNIELDFKQDRRCMYNVTLRLIRANTVAVEKQ